MSASVRERFAAAVREQLPHTLQTVDLEGFGTKIPGKVRDSYVVGDRRVLITSDRLSAFDVILTTIPFKGQLLNGIASFWFEKTADIVPNHLLENPHPNVFISKQVNIIPIEVVVRGYLAGSAWRDYQANRPVSGITLPAGLKEFSRFDAPLLTPSTKAEAGTHDEPISTPEILRRGIVSERVWSEVSERAIALFQRGSEIAAERGLLLVDTKYEFGLDPNGRVVLADEIHTQDSSRYWMKSSYEERLQRGEAPEMLDKEFFRRWLIERGYMGDGPKPTIPDDFRIETALKYIEAYELITGQRFSPLLGDQTLPLTAAVERSSSLTR